MFRLQQSRLEIVVGEKNIIVTYCLSAPMWVERKKEVEAELTMVIMVAEVS